MIVRQVIGLFLVCDKCWDAFQHEVEIVRAERSVIGVIVRTPGFQWLENLAHACLDVAAPTERISRHAADAGIECDHRSDFVELRAVSLYIFVRTNSALFFAAEKHEANRAFWQQSRRLDRARRLNDQ